MKRILCVLAATTAFIFATSKFAPIKHVVSTHKQHAWYEKTECNRTTYKADYVSEKGDIEDPDIQCPIPMECRVRNHTGTQCVFSSIEMLGRWAEEPKLVNPPITSDSECRSYSGPSHAAKQLRRLNVKFEQVAGDREASIKLIKKAMAEGRGCLFDVPGHAMVLVHYDEEKDVVKWVDNSDRTLKIQTMTVAKFKQRWEGWSLVIYADKDIIPDKLGRNNYWRVFPIKEGNTSRPINQYYIPSPNQKAASILR